MRTTMIALPLTVVAGLMMTSAPASAASATACKFDRMPLMLIISRGGMGASDNTLQVGDAGPVPISIGSGLMTATVGAQELVISTRLPASVSIGTSTTDTQTYHGECIGHEI